MNSVTTRNRNYHMKARPQRIHFNDTFLFSEFQKKWKIANYIWHLKLILISIKIINFFVFWAKNKTFNWNMNAITNIFFNIIRCRWSNNTQKLLSFNTESLSFILFWIKEKTTKTFCKNHVKYHDSKNG
jgi:hypothetical protein